MTWIPVEVASGGVGHRGQSLPEEERNGEEDLGVWWRSLVVVGWREELATKGI